MTSAKVYSAVCCTIDQSNQYKIQHVQMFTNSKTFTTVSQFKISELLQGAKLAWLVMPVSYQSHLYLHNEKTTTRETGCLFYPVTNSASTFHQIKVGVLNCPNQTKKPVLAIISLA